MRLAATPVVRVDGPPLAEFERMRQRPEALTQLDDGSGHLGRLPRRGFLVAAAAAAVSCLARDGEPGQMVDPGAAQPFFLTRGLILTVPELEAMDCPRLAHQSGINTLDLAHYSQWVAETEAGQRVLAACLDLGIDVEFSLHVPTVFLPRELFEHDRTMFRMDDDGNRVPDANLCLHSERALEILCENAAKHAAIMRPTTHRYYYWVDDGQPMCRCPECRGLSDSEQALVIEHRILEALRRDDPEATLCHLAYQKTMQPPTQVKPQPGIFLQFAPIERNTLKPLTDADASLLPGWPSHGQIVQWLDANLEVFGPEGAQVLEYWLDNARHSRWKREQVREVPWDEGTFLEDLRAYAGRGVRHIRTYAVWLDSDYVTQYGLPPFDEYGRGLLRWRLIDGHAVEREDL